LNTPLYIFGESYGGKYVPNIAKYIVEMNDFSSNDTDINLAGIGIVDGFTSPLNTAQELGMYAFNLGMLDF
jgi:vitellogenic carboxypeptidase-like protein